LRKAAEDEQRKLKKKLAETGKEIAAMKAKAAEEKARRDEEERERKALEDKLKQAEEKLIVGGKLMDKAARQEIELRKAKAALEDQRQKELQLARELAEKEDRAAMVEEDYASLHEAATMKTQKLRKVYAIYQRAKQEVNDVKMEHRRERESVLEEIRMLSKHTLHLDLVLRNAIPAEEMQMIEQMANYDEAGDTWVIPRAEFAGRKISRPRGDGRRRHEGNDELTRTRFLMYDKEDPMGFTGAVSAGSAGGRDDDVGPAGRRRRPRSGRRPASASKRPGTASMRRKSSSGSSSKEGRSRSSRSGSRSRRDDHRKRSSGDSGEGKHAESGGGNDEPAYPTARGLVGK